MKRILSSAFITGAVWLAVNANAQGVAQGTGEPARGAGEYQKILVRNPFGLKPPPMQRKPTVPAPAQSTLRLTGLITFDGLRKACFVVTPPGKAEGEYVTLAEGERAGDLSLLGIYPNAGSVRVRQGDQDREVSWEQGVPPAVSKQASLPPGP